MMETRSYYVPLPSYTYNDTYMVSKYGKRRLFLKPHFKKYKSFCFKCYLLQDIHRAGMAITDDVLKACVESEQVPGNLPRWADKEHMYDVEAWFGFPSEVLVHEKSGIPKARKDTDGLFKLTIDSLFEYFGFGDQYMLRVKGQRVLTDEDEDHQHEFHFAPKQEPETKNSFVFMEVTKHERRFDRSIDLLHFKSLFDSIRQEREEMIRRLRGSAG